VIKVAGRPAEEHTALAQAGTRTGRDGFDQARRQKPGPAKRLAIASLMTRLQLITTHPVSHPSPRVHQLDTHSTRREERPIPDPVAASAALARERQNGDDWTSCAP
jgi:hypothetical protein